MSSVEKYGRLHKIKEKVIFEETLIEDIFHIEGGNSGLTEEFTYYNLPSNEDEIIEIFTGATLDENKMGIISRLAKPNGRELKIFQGPVILVVRKGLAGKMFHIEKEEFTTNDDAYVLTPKKDWKDKINLKWFIHEYQDLFFNLVTSKSDNATFNKGYASRQSVKIPDIDIQDEIAGFALRTENVKRVLVNTVDQLHEVKENILEVEELNAKSFKETLIEKIFHIEGGNSGLTEEFIYYNLPINEEESIEILSSATLEVNRMGCVSRNAKPDEKKLKIFRSPAILVTRNGYYAGSTTYISSGEFTTNDHAYVLTPKKDWKDKINLKWFIHEYQDLFFNLVTSKSDNATFDKGYASRQIVKIPDIDFQNAFVKKIEYMESIIAKLREIEKEIDEQLEYAIV